MREDIKELIHSEVDPKIQAINEKVSDEES